MGRSDTDYYERLPVPAAEEAELPCRPPSFARCGHAFWRRTSALLRAWSLLEFSSRGLRERSGIEDARIRSTGTINDKLSF